MSEEYIRLLCIANMIEDEHEEFATALRKIAVQYRRLERFADEAVAEAQEEAQIAEAQAQVTLRASMEEAALDVAMDRKDAEAVRARRGALRELRAIVATHKELKSNVRNQSMD